MGRSVNYLNNASRINYFDYPSFEDEDGNVIQDDTYDYVLEDIQETMISEYTEFTKVKNKWDNNETRIILEGYGVEIGLSEYCGLCSLSVRPIDEDDTDAIEWIDKHWETASKYWNKYIRVGTFSNGEAVLLDKQSITYR